MRIVIKNPDEFKQVVIKKGFSQRKFGHLIGISESYACNIINGNKTPGPAVAKKIAEVLEVDFDDIFFIQSGCKSAHSELAVNP